MRALPAKAHLVPRQFAEVIDHAKPAAFRILNSQFRRCRIGELLDIRGAPHVRADGCQTRIAGIAKKTLMIFS